MNEQEFKQQIITNFIATYCAINYDDMCAKGNYNIIDNPPVEDAEHIAEKAWKEWVKIHNEI